MSLVRGQVFSLDILTIPPTPAPGVTSQPMVSLPPVVTSPPTVSPPPVTGGFAAVGCYVDLSSDRLLTGVSFVDEPTMSAEVRMSARIVSGGGGSIPVRYCAF